MQMSVPVMESQGRILSAPQSILLQSRSTFLYVETIKVKFIKTLQNYKQNIHCNNRKTIPVD